MLIIQKSQYKHAVYLFRFGMIFGVILTAFCLYLLNTNYFMFKNALLVHAPKIVGNLNAELKLANELIIAALVIYGIFMAFLGLQLSHRVVVPIYLIQEKLKAICRGDLKNANLTIRKTDDFQEFCESYNYLVEVLKTQTKADLDRLEAMKPDPRNFDAYHVWETMVHEKKMQLGLTDASTDQADVLHRVS